MRRGGRTSDKYAKEECCISLGVCWCIYFSVYQGDIWQLEQRPGAFKACCKCPSVCVCVHLDDGTGGQH